MSNYKYLPRVPESSIEAVVIWNKEEERDEISISFRLMGERSDQKTLLALSLEEADILGTTLVRTLSTLRRLGRVQGK